MIHTYSSSISKLFIWLVLIICLSVPCIFFPQDWGGWFLLYFSFILPLAFSEFRNSKKTYRTLCITLVIYHLMAISNAYIVTTKGGTKDAIRFHLDAQVLANGDFLSNMTYGVRFYLGMLSSVYRIFGSSILVGAETSIIAYVISVAFLVKLINLLHLQSYKTRLILLYGLLPSQFMFCSATLREAWEILFFVMCLYFGIKLRQNATTLTFVLFIVSNLLMGLLHKGLIIYNVFFLIPFTAFWASKIDFRLKSLFNKKDFRKKVVIITLTVAFFLGGIGFIGAIDSGAFQSVIKGEALEHTQYKRNSTVGHRTDYGGDDLDTTSIGGLVKTFPRVFFMYMFAPMPWQVSQLMDIYGFAESILRYILLLGAINLIRKQKGEIKSQYVYLFICFLALELLWSVGTKNWGTAIRHRVVAYPVLVILGGYYFWNIIGSLVPTIKTKKI